MKNYQNKQYLAISAIWYERFLECSRTQGTQEFPQSVWRFYHSLLNLDVDELEIKKKVEEYVENTWEPNIKEQVDYSTRYTNDIDVYDFEYRQITAQHIHELFSFIIQTIQDTGIGWHTTDNMQNFNITQE